MLTVWANKQESVVCVCFPRGAAGARAESANRELHGRVRAVPEIETAPNAMLEELRRAHL